MEVGGGSRGVQVEEGASGDLSDRFERRSGKVGRVAEVSLTSERG